MIDKAPPLPVVSHLRSFGRGETRYDWQPYIPLIERKPGALRKGAPFADMPAPMQKLRGLLPKREGSDRILAKVLAAVPVHGLDALLVAVELVLESGTVDGKFAAKTGCLLAAPLGLAGSWQAIATFCPAWFWPSR